MKTYIRLVLSISFCLIAFAGFSQTFTDDVNDIPLDGGISILVAAGVGYGVKKARDHRNKKKTPGKD